MLHYVEADHAVEHPGHRLEVPDVAQVALTDLQVRPAAETHAQSRQVLLVDIAGHEDLPPARQMLRHVTDPRTQLQHARPRSEEHTSELQSPCNLVCRLL